MIFVCFAKNWFCCERWLHNIRFLRARGVYIRSEGIPTNPLMRFRRNSIKELLRNSNQRESSVATPFWKFEGTPFRNTYEMHFSDSDEIPFRNSNKIQFSNSDFIPLFNSNRNNNSITFKINPMRLKKS